MFINDKRGNEFLRSFSKRKTNASLFKEVTEMSSITRFSINLNRSGKKHRAVPGRSCLRVGKVVFVQGMISL